MINAAFALSDSDKSGSIERREFARFFRLMEGLDKGNFQKLLFEIADKNHDGFVSQKELKIICKELKWEVPADKQLTEQEFIDFASQKLDILDERHEEDFKIADENNDGKPS